jgi:hypothetical protein
MFTEQGYLIIIKSNGKKKENRIFNEHRLDV